MPRASKPQERRLPAQTLVIDNGAHTMKAGFATSTPRLEDCQIIPNCLAKDRGKRVWIGAQLENCNDFGEIAFRRPVEKGFLVNWDAERAIFDSTFLDRGAKLLVSKLAIRYSMFSKTASSAIPMKPILSSQKRRTRLRPYKATATRSYSKSTNSPPTADA